MIDPHTLTIFDWFLVAIVAYSTLAAFLRGFFREIFSLVGLVAGIVLASWNYPEVAAQLTRWMALSTADVVGFLLIAVLVMVVAGLVGTLLQKTAKTIGLGFVDRLLGAAFGFARGFLLGIAVLMTAAAFIPGQGFLKNSVLSGYFLAGAHAVSFVVPSHLQVKIRAGTFDLQHRSPEWIKPRL